MIQLNETDIPTISKDFSFQVDKNQMFESTSSPAKFSNLTHDSVETQSPGLTNSTHFKVPKRIPRLLIKSDIQPEILSTQQS
jgi:hypothetical protein